MFTFAAVAVGMGALAYAGTVGYATHLTAAQQSAVDPVVQNEMQQNKDEAQFYTATLDFDNSSSHFKINLRGIDAACAALASQGKIKVTIQTIFAHGGTMTINSDRLRNMKIAPRASYMTIPHPQRCPAKLFSSDAVPEWNQ